MEQSNNFLSEMINSWLTEVDNVLLKGRPSWETLAEALNHPTIGQTALAQKFLSKVHKVSILFLMLKLIRHKNFLWAYFYFYFGRARNYKWQT